MNHLGAIPKAKGGARPKTKLTNGQITNQDYKEQYLSKQKLETPCDRLKGLSNQNNLSLPQPQQDQNSSKPLEEREVRITEGGVLIKRYALNPDWVEKRLFIHYVRPPLPGLDQEFVEGAMDAWIEQMEFLVEDLSWLLGLPHYRFWSQMVYDKSVHECLEYYLTSGPRWYEDLPRDDNCVAVMREIHQLVFLVYLRMATYKESKSDYITPSVFGDLIYENFLFDVCKLLEMCTLYGDANGLLLTKMVDNVFTAQPKYFNDLAAFVTSLTGVFENLEKKLGIFDLLTPRFVNPEVVLTVEELHDLTHYMLDTFSSILAFVRVFPRAGREFHEKEFGLKLSSFYEKAMPRLAEHLSSSMGEFEMEEDVSVEEVAVMRRETVRKVGDVRVNALALFREIFQGACFDPLSTEERNDDDEDDKCLPSSTALSKRIETFTHVLTSCAEERLFITDYQAMFPIHDDLAYFQDRGADMTSLLFVREAVDSIVSEMDLPTYAEEGGHALAGHPAHGGKSDSDTSGMTGYYAGESETMSGIELESLVCSVQDLLPGLGGGFVSECLKYYNYSSEEVVNAVLEGNLPPSLDALDRALQQAPSTTPLPQESPPQELDEASSLALAESLATGDLLVDRLNVYDDDDFDVFKQPTKFNKNKFHKGKRKGETYQKDPELADKMKSIIHEYEFNLGYSIYEDETKYHPIVAPPTSSHHDYDDEYDDTYDDNDAGDVDAFGNDKRRRGPRPVVTGLFGRGALNTRGMNFEEEEEEEEEGGGEQGKGGGEKEGAKRSGAWEGGGRGKPTERREEERKPNSKFKKANAVSRRGPISGEPGREGSNPSSMVFTNSRKGGRPGPGSGGGEVANRGGYREGNPKSRMDYRDSNNGTLSSDRNSYSKFSNDYRESTGPRNDYRNLNGANSDSQESNSRSQNDYRESKSGPRNSYRDSNSGFQNDYRNSKFGQNDHRESNFGSRNDYRESNSGPRNDYRESNSGPRNDYRDSNSGPRNDYQESNYGGARNDYRESRTSFQPFCENPEESRQRYEKKRMEKHFKNKGYYPQPPPQPQPSNNNNNEPGQPHAHTKTSTKTNKHSGKSWRQGPDGGGEENDNNSTHGGKYKEDTNHGKAQDRNHRHKMIHKNEQRRSAAQFKNRNNF